MTTTVSPDHYQEALGAFAAYAAADVDEALKDVVTALRYATDGVHRAQLTTARDALMQAKQALRWVKQ